MNVLSFFSFMSIGSDVEKHGDGGGMKMSRKAKRNKFVDRMVDFLDLPKDILLDLPRISMLGNSQISLENHKGILEYSPEVIRVNTSCGEMRIVGSGFVIQTILREEIVIDGRIRAIEYVDWGLV